MKIAIGFWIAGVVLILASCLPTDFWVFYIIAGVLFCTEGAVRALENR